MDAVGLHTLANRMIGLGSLYALWWLLPAYRPALLLLLIVTFVLPGLPLMWLTGLPAVRGVRKVLQRARRTVSTVEGDVGAGGAEVRR